MAVSEYGSKTTIEPVRRLNLHGQITGVVRDLIVEGRIAPGSHIIESELGRQLGVSRTPLREALKTLAGEGLVDLVPSRGAFVRVPTALEARELLEVLTGLESIAGRLACQRGSDQEIADLRLIQNEMTRAFKFGQRLEYHKLNIAIHAGFVALAHNSELRRQHETCSGRLRRMRFLATSTPERWAAAIEEHELMMRALEARDADTLAFLMRDHMRLIWQRIEMLFDDNGRARLGGVGATELEMGHVPHGEHGARAPE